MLKFRVCSRGVSEKRQVYQIIRLLSLCHSREGGNPLVILIQHAWITPTPQNTKSFVGTPGRLRGNDRVIRVDNKGGHEQTPSNASMLELVGVEDDGEGAVVHQGDVHHCAEDPCGYSWDILSGQLCEVLVEAVCLLRVTGFCE